MKKRWIGMAAVLMFGAVLTGCAPKEASQDFYAMDTAMNIRAYGRSAQDAVNECVQYINALEADISRTNEESDLYALNHAEGKPVTVSEQTADVIKQAMQLAQQTDGMFDPTIAPLSDLWGIGTEHARVPEQAEINACLPLIGYQAIAMDGTAISMPAQVQVDLGGIGKGYAADQAARILREDGIDRAIVMLGGNVYALGEKEKGMPWVVGITDPNKPGDYFATLAVKDTSIVTSGDYERYIEQDGKRYCHIFDPKTGYSAETDLRSVTVVSQNSTLADAYSTALYVMGFEQAQKFCEEQDIQAIFVRRDNHVFVTDGLKDAFSLVNTEYIYEG